MLALRRARVQTLVERPRVRTECEQRCAGACDTVQHAPLGRVGVKLCDWPRRQRARLEAVELGVRLCGAELCEGHSLHTSTLKTRLQATLDF